MEPDPGPGYYFASGPCCLCGRLFAFNPELVPSIPAALDGRITPDGVKRPICEDCMARINELRAAHGLPRIEVLEGAYEAAQGFPP